MIISPYLLLLVWVAGGLSDFIDLKALNSDELLDIRRHFEVVEKDIEEDLKLFSEHQETLNETREMVIRFKRDQVHKKGDHIEDINQKTSIGKLLYQGDIVLTRPLADEIIAGIEEEEGVNRTKRQAFRDHNYPNTIWRNGVNYCFDPYLRAKAVSAFRKGAEAWQKDTCIDFREDCTANDRIYAFEHSGCWSYVGRLGNEQRLSLGDGCDSVGIAAHEIGHALGMFHTQSRHDRDYHIYVNVNYIQRGWLSQFNRETTATNENYGTPYDYGSIMHYSARAASLYGEQSLIPTDPNYSQTLGSPFISFYELLMLNKHYNCFKNCKPETSAKCEMGGFPHPRDCRKCVCPSGYGGKLCNKRPKGCGEIVEAITSFKTLKIKVGDSRLGEDEREDFMKCNYWIKGPKDSIIVVEIGRITNGLAVDGCVYAGVEIKTHVDQRLTGYRFCAPEDAGVSLTSNHHIVPIIAYNRAYETEIVLRYRAVLGEPRELTTPGPLELWQQETVETHSNQENSEQVRPDKEKECEDDERCSVLMRETKFCSSAFPQHIKKRYCAKTCRLC